MEIILLEKVDNVGGIGDRVKVKSGYARNFLLPQGKATLATPENIAKFEKIRDDLEQKAATGLAKPPVRRSNAPRCPCTTARSACSASIRSICICTPTSTCPSASSSKPS